MPVHLVPKTPFYEPRPSVHDLPAKKKIVVASNTQLSQPSYINRLAMSVVAMKIPRRRLVERIEEALARYDGDIVWASGVPFTFGDFQIYEDFKVEKDKSQRWVGDFYRFAIKPPRQTAQNKILERLRWIDLFVKIELPERAVIVQK